MQIRELFKKLFPIYRSLTGKGNLQTLRILQDIAYFDIKNFQSGIQYSDWTIPDEYTPKTAYVIDLFNNKKIIDFKNNNLHLVGYSININTELSFKELTPHLYYLVDKPNCIPYRTSYYKPDWGFCLSYNDFQNINPKSKFKVVIDSDIDPNGKMVYGEQIFGNPNGQTYIFTTYCCHPAMANDNLSGMILWTYILKELKNQTLNNRYIFLIFPETIGSIAWIHENYNQIKKIHGGMSITTVLGPGNICNKTAYKENELDDIINLTLNKLNINFDTYPFDYMGSDERQFFFNHIPISSVCKSKYYTYPEYHTSLDNLDYIDYDSFNLMLKIYLSIIDRLDKNQKFTYCGKCEPMLSKYNLRDTIGGNNHNSQLTNKLIYEFKNSKSIMQISKQLNIDYDQTYDTAVKLKEKGILI